MVNLSSGNRLDFRALVGRLFGQNPSLFPLDKFTIDEVGKMHVR